jgi:hypothetical protein
VRSDHSDHLRGQDSSEHLQWKPRSERSQLAEPYPATAEAAPPPGPGRAGPGRRRVTAPAVNLNVSSPRPSDPAIISTTAAARLGAATYGRCLWSAAALARAVGDGSQARRTVDSRHTEWAHTPARDAACSEAQGAQVGQFRVALKIQTEKP